MFLLLRLGGSAVATTASGYKRSLCDTAKHDDNAPTISLSAEVALAALNGKPLAGNDARHYIRGCLQQLKRMHDSGFIHGDLHMHTVMVDAMSSRAANGGASSVPQVFLRDCATGIPVGKTWGELLQCRDAGGGEGQPPPCRGRLQHPPELWTDKVVVSPKRANGGHLSAGTSVLKKWSKLKLSPEAVVEVAKERSKLQQEHAVRWQQQPVDPSHDCWSAGIILYTLLSTGHAEAPSPEAVAKKMVERIELEGGGTEGARAALEFALKPFSRWERRLLKMMLEPDPSKRPPVGLLLHLLQDGTPSSGVTIPTAYDDGKIAR